MNRMGDSEPALDRSGIESCATILDGDLDAVSDLAYGQGDVGDLACLRMLVNASREASINAWIASGWISN